MFLFPVSVFAISTPVEKVFKDIDKNYKYYNELQTLYDKGMFFPDKNGNFNPRKLLSRQEFIWVVSEINCKKCIKPRVDYDYILKYSDKETFFDVSKNSKYSYCIALAKDLWEIKWYDIWTICEDWTSSKTKSPFCPKNTIILEEALAILLRTSNILTENEAKDIRNKIKNWTNFWTIFWNIKPKLLDWSIYNFYPDFKKALEYEIIDYDTNGNKKTYKLIEWNYINPKKQISREEFLKMAYLTFKSNSCINSSFNDIALKIKVLDKNCNEKIEKTCKLSDLKWDTFDFIAETSLENEDNIKDENWYIWRFYNMDSWEEIIKYSKYVDNYKFLKPWKYRVYLSVKTNKWKKAQVFSDFSFWTKNNLVNINTNFISWNKDKNISFEWLVSNPSNIKSYFWEFWDSEISYWKKVNHIFNDYWIYKVRLNTKDFSGKINSSTVLISIYDKKECIKWEKNCLEDIDTDSDSVLDKNDKCPFIFWVKENYGCPIFEKKCKNSKDCAKWSFCFSGFCRVKDFARNCEYSWWDLFYGNVICKDCPCNYKVDFNAKIRKCDIIFPAITSPDETKIYSKWNFYRIK